MMRADDCIRALQSRFGSPAYALIEQVANGTGGRARRWADAIAISLWPSRGLSVHGFEIKVTRRDWLDELHNPAKSAPVQAYCDHWWVVGPQDLVREGELPKTWGLIEVTSKLKPTVVVQAPELEPKALDRSFVAAVLRRAAEAHDGIAQRERAIGREQGAAEGAGELAARLKRAESQLAELWQSVRAFEAASGVRINDWNGGKIGEAVRVVQQHGVDLAATLRQDAQRYRSIAARLEEDAATLTKATDTEAAQ
jgi:hypothetical protein